MTALREVLADPARQVGFVLVANGRDPATDAEADHSFGTSGTPESFGFPAYLADPGGRSVAIALDEDTAPSPFARYSRSPAKLENLPDSQGGTPPLDYMRDLTFSGRDLTVYCGAVDEAFSAWEPVLAGVADGEPLFDRAAGTVEFRWRDPLARLRREMNIPLYVGEPGAIETRTHAVGAAAPFNAAYQLPSFTVTCRVRLSAVGAANLHLRHNGSGGQYNWIIRVLGAGSGANAGRADALYYTGGVQSVRLIGTSAIPLEVFSSLVFAHRPGYTYLMVAGVVEAESTSTAAPDTPATGGVVLAQNANGSTSGVQGMDFRVYNYYMSPDEARAKVAVRATEEDGLVGLWRCDDRGGNKLTDYSSTAAHAVLGGIEGVDYGWVSSDLGEADSAGRSMAAVLGDVTHAPADYVDTVLERWRLAEDSRVDEDTIELRDAGQLLDPATDYDLDGPSAQLASKASQPVTFARSYAGAGFGSWSGAVINQLLGMAGEEEDHYWTPFGAAYPVRAGLWTRRRPTDQPIAELIGGGLGYVAPRSRPHVSAGRQTLAFGILMPPTSPSPRDGGCLEMVSPDVEAEASCLEWIGTGDPTTADFSVACWFRSHRWGPSEIPGDRLVLMDTSFGNPYVRGWRLCVELGTGTPRLVLERYEHSTSAVQASASVSFGRLFDEDTWRGWWFVGVAHAQSFGATNFFAAPAGGSVALLGVDDDLAFPSAPQTAYMAVGAKRRYDAANDRDFHAYGSVYEPSVHDGIVSQAGFQALMDAPPAGSGIVFYAPLDSLAAASITDTVSSVVPTVHGDVRAVPDLEVDLRFDPHAFKYRMLRPASSVRVEYARNFAVLADSDIAVAVTDVAERLALQKEALWEPWESPSTADDYRDARLITIPALWTSRAGALAALRIALYRYGAGREAAELAKLPDRASSPFDRAAVTLEVADEVRVWGADSLASGPTFRVTSCNSQLADLHAALELVR